jgi:hypothetical protein
MDDLDVEEKDENDAEDQRKNKKYHN